MNHWMSESVDAMGMCPVFFFFRWERVWETQMLKPSLIRRSLEVFANDLGFRIELVIRGYHFPGRIIFDDATFIR